MRAGSLPLSLVLVCATLLTGCTSEKAPPAPSSGDSRNRTEAKDTRVIKPGELVSMGSGLRLRVPSGWEGKYSTGDRERMAMTESLWLEHNDIGPGPSTVVFVTSSSPTLPISAYDEFAATSFKPSYESSSARVFVSKRDYSIGRPAWVVETHREGHLTGVIFFGSKAMPAKDAVASLWQLLEIEGMEPPRPRASATD